MINSIGYLASLGALLMWLPQGWRVVHHRDDSKALEGISVGAYATGVVFNALLLVYGLGTHALPVVLAASVNLIMSSLIVVIVRRSRERA